MDGAHSLIRQKERDHSILLALSYFYFWYIISFLAGLVWAGTKCTVHVALPKKSLNQYSKADKFH